MPKPVGILKLAIALGLVALMAACSPIVRYHGFVPTEQDLKEIQVGLDTRTTVESIIGKPGASGLLADGAWYYVRSEFKQEAWKAPQEVDRQVVAISFDKNDVVKNIERFGLDRGEVVVLSRRVTDSNVEGISFLRQLFGNTSTLNNVTGVFGNN
jgi:outer membrane protein assembly factor BamE (lipoprotein component of BamABCDE complex)